MGWDEMKANRVNNNHTNNKQYTLSITEVYSSYRLTHNPSLTPTHYPLEHRLARAHRDGESERRRKRGGGEQLQPGVSISFHSHLPTL